MDDPLRVIGGDHHDLEQSHARVDADYQQSTFVVAFLLDEPERVADDVQRVCVGDAVFRVVLAGGFSELHRVKDGLTRG